MKLRQHVGIQLDLVHLAILARAHTLNRLAVLINIKQLLLLKQFHFFFFFQLHLGDLFIGLDQRVGVQKEVESLVNNRLLLLLNLVFCLLLGLSLELEDLFVADVLSDLLWFICPEVIYLVEVKIDGGEFDL